MFQNSRTNVGGLVFKFEQHYIGPHHRESSIFWCKYVTEIYLDEKYTF